MTVQPNSKSMRSFIIIFIGQTLSAIGSSLVQFGIVWWMTDTTGSAIVLSTAALVGFIPQAFLSPFIGPLIDRWNRKRVLFLADGLIALVTLALLGLFMFSEVALWQVYLVLFIRSVGGAFHYPTMQATTAMMVPKKHLTRIAGFNQMMQGAIPIIAAPLGALIYGLAGVQALLSIDVVTAAFAILPLFFIFVPSPERTHEASQNTYIKDLKDGFIYLWNWPGMLIIVALAAVLNMILVPMFTLLPLLVTETFDGGAGQYALSQSLMSVGIIVGGLVLGAWGGFKSRKIYTTIMGLAMMAVGLFVVGFAPANLFIMMLAGLVLTGLALPFVNGPIQAIRQSTIEPDMQGRVTSLMMGIGSLAAPLGLAVAGPISEIIGVQSWFFAGGGICAMLAGSVLIFPAVRNVEDRKDAITPSASTIDETEQGDLIPAGAEPLSAK